jgi:hypothetical protein
MVNLKPFHVILFVEQKNQVFPLIAVLVDFCEGLRVIGDCLDCLQVDKDLLADLLIESDH